MADNVKISKKGNKIGIKREKWTTREDNLLRKAIRQYGNEWLSIAQKFKNRNPNQCSQRWKKLSGLYIQKKNFWTKEEDERLLELLNIYGQKWSIIEQNFNGRTSKQCRDRYLNMLDPNLNKQEFSFQEDETIYQQFLVFGSKWSKIAIFLPNRSQNQIKNRFYTYIRKNFLQIKNPYFSKSTQQEAREELEQARKQHLVLIQNYSKPKLIFFNDADELDFQSNDFNHPQSFRDCINDYSEINFEF